MKKFLQKIFRKISGNIIARNLVLAFCGVLVFVGISAVVLAIITRHGQQKPVPDFIGTPISDVERIARRANLEIEIIDSIYAPIYGGGVVIEQVPGAGTEVKKGRRIFVTITSHQQKMVPVPFVTGLSLRQAKNMIEMALAFGADDIDGTIDDSTKIFSMAGAEETTPRLTIAEIEQMAVAAGLKAIERDTFYNEI